MRRIPFGKRLKPFLGSLVIAIGMTAAIGFADYTFFGSTFRQLAARSYPTTTGTITGSKVATSEDSDGVSYRPAITFSYEVAGEPHENHTWRYGNLGLSDSTFAERIVATYPVDREVTVHYNAADPDEAVISTDLDGTDAFGLLFMSTFNLATLGAWCLCLYWLRFLITNPPAGGVKIIDRRNEIRARLPILTPLMALGTPLVGVCFASVFIAGFLLHMAPPPSFVAGVWSVAVIAGIAAYIWQSVSLARGKADLIIDRVNGTLSLAPFGSRKERREFSLDAVRTIEIATEVDPSDNGSSRTFVPWLVLSSGGETTTRREEITQFYSEARAQGFTQWLRSQIGLVEGA